MADSAPQKKSAIAQPMQQEAGFPVSTIRALEKEYVQTFRGMIMAAAEMKAKKEQAGSRVCNVTPSHVEAAVLELIPNFEELRATYRKQDEKSAQL